MVMLTRFELARLISARALQLSLGAPPMIKVEDSSMTMQELAKKEFEEKVLPLTVLRELPNGKSEKLEVF